MWNYKDTSSPSARDIRQQLDRILQCERFAKAYQLQRFLSYVVEESMKDSEGQFGAYSIATMAFGRSDDFDPNQDPIVRIQAGKLRTLLDQYYQTDGAADPLVISLPKGGYRPTMTWRDQPDTSNLGCPSRREAPSLGEAAVVPIVAVVPCHGPQNDDLCAAFQYGFDEELIASLSRFEEIGVVPIDAQGHTRQNLIQTSERARQCQADFLLEARLVVQGRGSKLFVKLLSGLSGRCIWADTLVVSRKMMRSGQEQHRIANDIASRIAQPFGYAHRDRIVECRSKSVESLAVYECILQAHHYYLNATAATHERALQACRRAVQIDPSCSLAWATLADLYCEGYRMIYQGFDETGGFLNMAQKCAATARQLNPDTAHGLLALANISFARGNLSIGVEIGDHALSLNPGNQALKARYGQCRAFAGDWNAGLELLHEATSGKSFLPSYYFYAMIEEAFHRDDFESALKHLDRIESPDTFYHPMARAMNLARLDRRCEARSAIDQLRRHQPQLTARSVFAVNSRDLNTLQASKCDDALRSAGLPA